MGAFTSRYGAPRVTGVIVYMEDGGWNQADGDVVEFMATDDWTPTEKSSRFLASVDKAAVFVGTAPTPTPSPRWTRP